MIFLRVFLGTLALCLLCWGILVWGQMGRPTKNTQWVYDVYKKKREISKRITERKIVLVAGSNVMYGINSRMMEKAFGLPVLNDAVNAGIDLPCILQISKEVINPGDIVILPLEFDMYTYQGKPGVQHVDYVLSRKPACFWKHHLKEQLYLFWHIPFERIIEGYFDNRHTPVAKGAYGAHHIDDHGDQTHSAASQRYKGAYQDVLDRYVTKPPYRYGKEFDRNAPGWKYIEEFVSWCKARQVTTIFMPATLLPHKSYYDDPKERWYFTHIGEEIEKRGWMYVGKPYDYMYDTEYYYNTDFHLTDEGRTLRTLQLIKDLNSTLMPLLQK